MKTIVFLLFLVVVLCNCIPSEVEKAFLDNQIVPDSIQSAPWKVVNVCSKQFHSFFCCFQFITLLYFWCVQLTNAFYMLRYCIRVVYLPIWVMYWHRRKWKRSQRSHGMLRTMHFIHSFWSIQTHHHVLTQNFGNIGIGWSWIFQARQLTKVMRLLVTSVLDHQKRPAYIAISS